MKNAYFYYHYSTRGLHNFSCKIANSNIVLHMLQVLEMGLSGDGQLSRLKTADDLIASVRGIQQFAAVRSGVAKGQMFKDLDARHADPSLDLLTPGSSTPKYSLFLVDQEKSAKSLKFAVFIVPQGRLV